MHTQSYGRLACSWLKNLVISYVAENYTKMGSENTCSHFIHTVDNFGNMRHWQLRNHNWTKNLLTCNTILKHTLTTRSQLKKQLIFLNCSYENQWVKKFYKRFNNTFRAHKRKVFVTFNPIHFFLFGDLTRPLWCYYTVNTPSTRFL